MKKQLIQLMPTALAAGVFLAGCAEARTVSVRHTATRANPAGELVVTQLPPAPSREVIDSGPGEPHVWVGSCWVRCGGRWLWLPPHWE